MTIQTSDIPEGSDVVDNKKKKASQIHKLLDQCYVQETRL